MTQKVLLTRKPKLPEIFMATLALVSVVLIVTPTILPLSYQQRTIIYLVDISIVTIFALEFISRLSSELKRAAFLKQHWYEVFAMLPLVFFVALEANLYIGAVLRLLRTVRILRFVGITSRLMKLARITG